MCTPSQSERSSGIPLRLVLIVPFVIQVALVVGLVGYLSFRNGQKAVNNVAHQLRSEITARIQEHIHTFLATPHHINQINANAIRQGVLEANDLAALERHLWEQIQIFDSVTSIYFGNTEGGLVDAGREGAQGSLYVIITDAFKSGAFRKYATDNNGNRAELLTTLPDFDARTRAWYAGAVEKRGATWSDVYILFTGQDMAVAASQPVYGERNNLLGVVSTDIFVSHISNFLNGLRIGETGSSFIMERSGLLVASSTDEKPFTAPDNGEAPRRLYASESTIPMIRHAAAFLTEQFGDYHNITDEQHFEFSIEGQRQFLQVSTIRDEYGIDWLLVVVIPESDFMEQININNRTTALLIGLALMLTVGAGIITSQWITAPISRLNTSTQALAEGEWEHDPGDSRISEISELAQSFNYMALQLRQTLENLTSEIAERKRVAAALREANRRLRGFMSHSPMLVSIFDQNGRYQLVNSALADVLKRPQAEIVGKTFAEVLPSHVVATFMSRVEQLIKTDAPIVVDDHVMLDGAERIFETVLFPLAQRGDEIATFGSIATDITERKQAATALLESETRLRAIGDNLPAGLIYQLRVETDGTARFTYVSAAVERLHECTVEEVLNDPAQLFDRMVEEDIPAWRRATEKSIRELSLYDHTLRIHRKSGEIRWHRMIAKPRRLEDGAVLFDGIDMDITEQKQAEDALRQSKRRLEETLAELRETQEHMMHQERLVAVGQLAAGIAHDFNNILASITLYTQMSLREKGLSSTLRKRLEAIAERAGRAAELVQQILDFSRRAVIERRLLVMGAFLEEVVQLLARTLPESVQMELVVEPSAYVINADPARIQQVLVNLALNARDAMPDGGKLHIALSSVEGAEINCVDCGQVVGGTWVQVTVQDNGTGIPPEVLPHIFEPFFTTRAPLGHGLGLAQVYGIVKQHGGHIEVETEVGRGTAFKLYWPALLADKL